jgi:Tol biopolymer transport system component
VKAHFLPALFVFSLIVSSCSIEISQTPQAVPPLPTKTNPAQSSTPMFPTTQVPVTWGDLHLTGKLIYPSSITDGNKVTATIQIVDLVTGELATLFSASSAWIYYAAVSPDDKWLVISYAPPLETNPSPNRTLYIMPLDASNAPQPLFAAPTPDDHYTQAEWSPDGKYIYYVHYNHAEAGGGSNEVYEIFRMTFPDGKPEKIIDHASWPRLSSDSTKLVYVSLDPASGKNELFLANADGSDPQQIPLAGPQPPDIIDAPMFLSDGQSILFSAPSPGQSYQPKWLERLMGIQVAKAHNIRSDWWSVPMTGGVPRQLTHIQEPGLFASLSPDQKHLSSLSAEGIFMMDLDGSSLTQVISDPNAHGTVDWIP